MTLSIPGYQVGELLGYGSYGEVWSAMSRRTGEHVAIKRVQLSAGHAVTAIRGEAALLAALSHPNIIALREFLEAADGAMLVMELAAGGSLNDLLARRGRLTHAEVGVCFSDLAAALAHAHDEGVLHGDVSASNVLFTVDGRAKLADLGLARVFSQSPLGLGTPAYVDPVVAAGGAAGAASDVFSLAAVALHALTGDGPWAAAGRSAEEVLAVAATAEVVDLHERIADCPADLSAALVRALDPEPCRRGTAAELALDLRAAVVPTTVTVQAGRLGPAGGRHYARAGSSRPGSARESAGGDSAAPFDRPDFPRPELGGPSADLTHASRPDFRALLTPEPESRSRLSRVLSHRVVLAAVVLVALAAGSVAVFGRFAGHSVAASLPGSTPKTASSSAKVSGSPKVISPPKTTGASSPATSVSVSTVASMPSADDVAEDLRVIDARRSAAFATGRADLLADVYDSPRLLAQDTAQLRRVVGASCALTPLTTDYRDIVVSPLGQGGVDLTAMVSTSAAQLSCHGKVTGRVEASTPTALTITLTRRPDGAYRISSQRPAGA